MVQNPIIIHDNEKSHTAAGVTAFLLRWQWEILTRYESMRLRSVRQSERTKHLAKGDE